MSLFKNKIDLADQKVHFVGSLVEELAPVIRWNWRTGWTVTYRWRGQEPEIEKKVLEQQNKGAEDLGFEFEGNGYCVMSATYPSLQDGTPVPATITTIWTRHVNTLEKSIYLLPKYKALKAETLSEVKIQIEKNVNFTTGLANVRKAAVGANVNPAIAEELFRLLWEGTDTFWLSQYVLRKTRIAPRNANIKADDVGVGQIFSSQSLRVKEGVPDNLFFSLPAGVWLKMPTDVDQQTDGRWILTEEWWHADSADTAVYGSVQ